MMLTKPRSAPSSLLQSRLAKNQSEAMKEMQEWARRAEEPGACHVSRMSGQLTENVTEERMLRAKLWELSKERYKFLIQNSYEKKLFADRMQRKTHAMLKARANSAATMSRTGKVWPVTTSTLSQLRPFTTSSLGQFRPVSKPSSRVSQAWSPRSISKNVDGGPQISAATSDHSRPASTSKNVEGRPISSSTNDPSRPVSSSNNAVGRPKSLSKNIKRFPNSTSKNAEGRPMSTSKSVEQRPSTMNTEGKPQNTCTYTYGDTKHEKHRVGLVQHRPKDVDPTLQGRLDISDNRGMATVSSDDRATDISYKDRADTSDGRNMATDTSDSKDTSTSEDRNSQMREVERKWVMSSGRGRVTPAATPICIPPPNGVYSDDGGRMVLAPIPDTPASPVPSQNNSKPHSSLVRITATNPRNVKFSQVCVGKRRLSQTGSHKPTANVPSPGVLPTRRPSESTVSSKPTSATSRRSKPRSTAQATSISAALLGHRRGLLQRYGMRLESKTSDPRYASLEHSLTPVQPHPPSHTDVSTIVQNFDALHVQPKLRKEIKAKTELKALKYMNDRGFVF